MTDGPNRQYLSTIRAAVRVLQRPTAAILRDHFAHFRDYMTGEPISEPYWTDWDYSLLEAFQMIEDYQESETGHFPWETQDEDIHWQGYTIPNGNLEAVERYQEAHKKADGSSSIPAGDRVAAKIDWKRSRKPETMRPSEWFVKQSEKAAKDEKSRRESHHLDDDVNG